MKTYSTKAAAVAAGLACAGLAVPCQAQFSGVLDGLKNRVEDAVGRQVGGQSPDVQSAGDGEPHRALRINTGFDFVRGATPIMHDDFAGTAAGAMPRTWKTNGSGGIATIDGIPGTWLALQNFATYKLTSPPQLPARFTLEFDVIGAADTSRDLNSLTFGFAKDNSVRSYIQDAYNDGAITTVDLGYAGDGSVSSSATGYHHSVDRDMRSTVNRVIHVSIAVDGDNEKVYLDNEKIADAQLFKGNAVKYFFMSAPVDTDHGARFLFGNFRIDGAP